jgi:hypothetical protein
MERHFTVLKTVAPPPHFLSTRYQETVFIRKNRFGLLELSFDASLEPQLEGLKRRMRPSEAPLARHWHALRDRAVYTLASMLNGMGRAAQSPTTNITSLNPAQGYTGDHWRRVLGPTPR